jgi:hypothetical protein
MNKQYFQNEKMKFGIFSRGIIFMLIYCYLNSFMNKNYILIFGNIPMFTFYYFEIFRLITGFFITENLFELIFYLFIIFTIFNYWENIEGTFKFTILIIMNLIIVQIVIGFLYIFLSVLFPILKSYQIKSLPFLGIAFLVKHLLLTNTKKIYVFPGKEFNDRFLVIIYFFWFLFLNGREFKIELIISFYYGFLMCKYPKMYTLQSLTNETVSMIENSSNMKFISNIDSYIIKSLDILHTPNIPLQNDEMMKLNNKINNNKSEEEINNLIEKNLDDNLQINIDITNSENKNSN